MHKAIADVVDHVFKMGPASEQSKLHEIEAFVGAKIPQDIHICPPDVNTKGNYKRKKGGLEQARPRK